MGWRFHLGNDWGTGYSLGKAEPGMVRRAPITATRAGARSTFPTTGRSSFRSTPLRTPRTASARWGGLPQNSTGWYRRTFDLPASTSGKRLWLEFDGVYRDCTVIVNGWFVGHHEGGYNGFRYDITDVANCGGRNVVTVRVDASQFEGWFYEGAGIYRHVWLVKTAPLAIAPDGVFVFSQFKANDAKGPAEIHMQAKLCQHAGPCGGRRGHLGDPLTGRQDGREGDPRRAGGRQVQGRR
jgi:hypothetical protein